MGFVCGAQLAGSERPLVRARAAAVVGAPSEAWAESPLSPSPAEHSTARLGPARPSSTQLGPPR